MTASFEHKYVTGIVGSHFQVKGALLENNWPYLMQPWDEVLGDVISIEDHEGHCLALIGKVAILLPLEISSWLSKAKGQRVGILRTDSDYRLRLIEKEH